MQKVWLSLCLAFGFLTAYANETITVGASPVPHAEILKQIKPLLKAQGYDLQIKEFSDYITPNLALSQGQLEANFFQHLPYLNDYNQAHGTQLIPLVQVHLEPMGLFANSKTEAQFIKTKQAKNVKSGSSIAIPNDPTNEGRALNILAKAGLISLKAKVAFPTPKDIIANPYKLKFKELDAAFITRAFTANQVDLAVINSNFALDANLNPLKDAVILENKNSPYANIIAIRKDEINLPKIKALKAAITSNQVKKYIETQYKGAVIPAF